ncbi:MAG: hypothetical protein ACKPFD_03775 [Dolichospermum sp.]
MFLYSSISHQNTNLSALIYDQLPYGYNQDIIDLIMSSLYLKNT